MGKREEKVKATVGLSKVAQDMRGGLGPKAKEGWIAAVDSDGTVRMAAGKGALGILEMNASAQGWTLARIVDDKA